MKEAKLDIAGAGRFRLSGDVDFETVPELWEESLQVFPAAATVEVDLASVGVADSSAVALLLAWTRWARARQQSIRFVRVPETMLAIARLSDLEELLPLDA